MRKSMKEAIGETLQDIINIGAKTSFSEKKLKEFGVEIPKVVFSAKDIQGIRESTKLSQSVFAKVLNVSPSSVRQWEQGKRKPSGSTMVLLELLKENPKILNYRVFSNVT